MSDLRSSEPPEGPYIFFGFPPIVAWHNSSTTATTVQTAHLLTLEITISTTISSTMTTFPDLLRSSSRTLSLPGSPLSDTTLSNHPDSPLITEDEEREYQAWMAYQPQRRQDMARLLRQEDDHDRALIQEWEKENIEDESEDELIALAQRTPSPPPTEPVRRYFVDTKPATCRCGLFQPCQECRMFLTNESLEMGLKIHSKSPTTSEEESSQGSDYPGSDLGLDPRDGRPDISCLQPLKVVTVGRINSLLTSVNLLVQSTEYHESSMLMEDIIFTLSSTSKESSNSRTATVSAWESHQETRVQSARLKLIATYYQLRAHPSTLGTTFPSMEMSSQKTAKDRALEELTSLATTCGLEAWLLQTKKSFLKTCKSILQETTSFSISKLPRTPTRSTASLNPRCRPSKKTASSFTGNGIRKFGSGLSLTSPTQSRRYVPLREESPTLLKQRRKMLAGCNYIDLTENDLEGRSHSSSSETLD